MVTMNRLSTEKRAAIIGCLVEGNSIRTHRPDHGRGKNTVTRLLVDLGAACAEYQDRTLRDLPCRTIECDEIWAFCYAKQKNVPEQCKGTPATATCGPGPRSARTRSSCRRGSSASARSMTRRRSCTTFAAGSPSRACRSPRMACAPTARRSATHSATSVDFAQLHKVYGARPELRGAERRYSPPVCTGTQVTVVAGDPDPGEISTSYVERQNLTMRMGMRRFTRLTNGFSKKVENLAHAVSLHYMHYNFARIHQTLRCTPGTSGRRHRQTLDADGHRVIARLAEQYILRRFSALERFFDGPKAMTAAPADTTAATHETQSVAAAADASIVEASHGPDRRAAVRPSQGQIDPLPPSGACSALVY